jgi:hypothetical protein
LVVLEDDPSEAVLEVSDADEDPVSVAVAVTVTDI